MTPDPETAPLRESHRGDGDDASRPGPSRTSCLFGGCRPRPAGKRPFPLSPHRGRPVSAGPVSTSSRAAIGAVFADAARTAHVTRPLGRFDLASGGMDTPGPTLDVPGLPGRGRRRG